MAKSRNEPDLDDAAPKPRSDAYTGLLVLSLLALVASAIFLYLDWNQYPTNAPKKVTDRPPAASTPTAPAAAAPASSPPAGSQPAPAVPAPKANEPAPKAAEPKKG